MNYFSEIGSFSFNFLKYWSLFLANVSLNLEYFYDLEFGVKWFWFDDNEYIKLGNLRF